LVMGHFEYHDVRATAQGLEPSIMFSDFGTSKLRIIYLTKVHKFAILSL